MKTVHVYIKGDVIGVGFRAWTKIQAKVVGVNGWVRNVFENEHIFGRNGGVEAVFQGEEVKIDKMLEIVKKGPPIARVEDLEIIPLETKEIYKTFEIRK